MKFVFDGAILLVLVLFTIFGVKKGFVRSVAEFLGAIAAAVAASWVGGMAAEFLYNTFFRQGVYDRITVVSQGASSQEAVEQFFTGLPDFIVRLLEMNGITAEKAAASVTGAGASVAQAVTDVLSPVFIGLIKVFAVIVLFLLFMVIIRAVAGLISGICSLPILRQVNGLLGGIFGFLMGTVIVWIVVGAIQFFEPMMAEDMRKEVSSTVDSSVVCKWVVSMNPVKWIFD